ncbi:MAG: AAA family ATPase [Coriobacteriaceae bacterium]|nr:AAA family ATPase [Coriobacteriaceae bacterium]
MRILSLESKNYKNLDGVCLEFADDINYIVGENNVGKSNVLNLLDTLFNRSSFMQEDFEDSEEPIEATLKLGISEPEIGSFGQLVDPDTGNTLTVCATCSEPGEPIEFAHAVTHEPISQTAIRNANYFKFASVSFDNRTLAFDSPRGVGRLLGRTVTRYRETEGKAVIDFFNQEEMDLLLRDINIGISRVPLLNSCGISVSADAANADALESVISLTDGNNVTMRSAGSGVQYLSLAILSILQGLASLSKRRVANSAFEIGDNKVLMGIIAFDEPEIHLHPYMQRRLVRALAGICSGDDDGFNSLVKDLLGVDYFVGQIILVTHSPEILDKGSYSNVIRLGYENSVLKVANGVDINLNSSEEKQLLSQFSTIREAFFARAVILVEGQTEEVALPEFASTLGVDLDDYGVLLIRVDGKKSIPGTCKLLKNFGIPNISIVDRDDTDVVSERSSLVTNRRDFEDEWIDSLFETNNAGVFFELVNEIGTQHNVISIQRKPLEKAFNKLGYRLTSIPEGNTLRLKAEDLDSADADSEFNRAMMYTYLSNVKGELVSRTLGRLTPKEAVPECYKLLFQKAMELV